MRRGGKFNFEFTVPPGYPHDAPKVLCATKVSRTAGGRRRWCLERIRGVTMMLEAAVGDGLSVSRPKRRWWGLPERAEGCEPAACGRRRSSPPAGSGPRTPLPPWQMYRFTATGEFLPLSGEGLHGALRAC